MESVKVELHCSIPDTESTADERRLDPTPGPLSDEDDEEWVLYLADMSEVKYANATSRESGVQNTGG